MKIELTSCFILHARPYRETSLLLDIFSHEHGRLSLIAKGVKRAKNSKAILLQPARKLNLAWSMRTDMGTLTAVESCGDSFMLSGRRLVSCFYLNELLVRLLHKHEPHPELFIKYEQSLMQLAAGLSEDRVLRIFEKNLLKSLGYGLVFDHEITSGKSIKADIHYFYQLDCGPLHEKPQNSNNVRVSGKTLQALDDENDWDDEIAREAKLLFRAILSVYTGPKPFASRVLYKAYIDNARMN